MRQDCMVCAFKFHLVHFNDSYIIAYDTSLVPSLEAARDPRRSLATVDEASRGWFVNHIP
jgi:hypothetical protein